MNRFFTLLLSLLSVCMTAHAQSADPKTPPILAAQVGVLATLEQGPFVQLNDGRLLCIRDDSAFTSSDGGKTWVAKVIFAQPTLMARPEQALIKMRDGTIVFIFLDDKDKRWQWDDQSRTTEGEAHLYVWSVRSTDGGETWTDLQRIQDGYSGAIRDIIETADGKLVVPVQKFDAAKGRHVTIPFVSEDAGKTWKSSNTLDLEGRGHHDGAIEATLVERFDHSLWMLIRTNLDCFYESISHDGGATWSAPAPTTIQASSSPGLVKRLASGRLILIWNRVAATTGESPERRGGQYSTVPASWHRGELSIAFSSDDGKSWGEPHVIATKPGAWLSYPYLLEHSPGELWITTMQGGLRLKLKEKDFVP